MAHISATFFDDLCASLLTFRFFVRHNVWWQRPTKDDDGGHRWQMSGCHQWDSCNGGWLSSQSDATMPSRNNYGGMNADSWYRGEWRCFSVEKTSGGFFSKSVGGESVCPTLFASSCEIELRFYKQSSAAGCFVVRARRENSPLELRTTIIHNSVLVSTYSSLLAA